jgi:serine/threonine-protein kinase
VVLYEMLTGRQAFSGETITDVLAAVVKTEPDWKGVPEKAARLLRRCLEKDPNRRLRHIADFELLLEQAAPHQSNTKLPWVVALALALIATVALWGLWRMSRPADQTLKPLVRLDVDLGPNVSLDSYGGANVVLSPDGTRMLYVSHGRLFTRRLDQRTAIELSGTEGAFAPFFSPDGKWVAFFALGKLKKIPIEGGTPQVLSIAPFPFGGSWGEDGNIIASLNSGQPLSRIPSAGGEPTLITELDRQHRELTHRYPQILPGGRAVLFTAHTSIGGGFDAANVGVVSLIDHRRTTLVRGGTFGRYLSTGHLVYINQGTLFAVPFDSVKLNIAGTPSAVVEHVAYSARHGFAWLSFSDGQNDRGTMVYQTGDAGELVSAQWLDAAGTMKPLLPKLGMYTMPRLSPDSDRLALSVNEGSSLGIWLYEWRADTITRLGFGIGSRNPVWSPDGRYIVFGGEGGMFWARSDGASKPQPLTQSTNLQSPWSFTSDGRRLAFMQLAATGYRLWTAPVQMDDTGLVAGKPELFLETPFDQRHP